MFKKVLFISIFFCIVENSFAENITVTIVINNITVNGGLLYVAIYSNEKDYKAENPFAKFILDPAGNTMLYNLELLNGEYVVSVFQDTNANGKLDTNFLGIPKEPVGITNYNGRGSPGNFQRLKVPVNSNSVNITVNMGRVRAI